MFKVNKILIMTLLLILFSYVMDSEVALAIECMTGTVVSSTLRCNVKVSKSDTVYVSTEYDENTTGWGRTKFNNLHDALVSVPENGTISIECSRYVLKHSKDKKPFTVNKNVIINGTSEPDTVIVIGEAFGSTGAIVVNSGKKLTLSNLTIEGHIYYTSHAIYSIGGDVSLNNVKIQKMNIDKNSCGVKVVNSPISGPGKLTVNNCSFNDIAGYAVYVYNSIAEIGIASGNTFTGGCSRTQADEHCAIRVENGVDVKIHNNIINGYKLKSAAGIYIHSGSAEILENEVLNCNTYRGIYVNTGSTIGSDKVSTENAVIIGNSLMDNNNAYIGIYNLGTRIYPAE